MKLRTKLNIAPVVALSFFTAMVLLTTGFDCNNTSTPADAEDITKKMRASCEGWREYELSLDRGFYSLRMVRTVREQGGSGTFRTHFDEDMLIGRTEYSSLPVNWVDLVEGGNVDGDPCGFKDIKITFSSSAPKSFPTSSIWIGECFLGTCGGSGKMIVN